MARTIPIIKLHRTLIVSIQLELSDHLVLELKNDLANEIRAKDAVGLILEVSGVDIIDSFIARSIRDIATVARLMGVRTILVGLDPGMATTLVEMGMAMEGVETVLDLETAVDAFAAERSDKSPGELDDLLAWSTGDDPLVTP